MRVISATNLQGRIEKAACEMDCKAVALAKQGKSSKGTQDALFEIMFIHAFLPYWNTSQLRQKECYLHDKFGI